jgi:DNA-directed RNA polymerase specialized sigma24 family protein
MLAVAAAVFCPFEEDARDAVQDASCPRRSIDRFEGNAALSTWLHRIVVNASLMKLRTRRRKPRRRSKSCSRLPRRRHFERPASPWRTEVSIRGARRAARARDAQHPFAAGGTP